MNHPPVPRAVQVRDGEHHSHNGPPQYQTKTFSELQQVLIRHDLVGEAVDRARVHAERGEPDAVTRFRDMRYPLRLTWRQQTLDPMQ